MREHLAGEQVERGVDVTRRLGRRLAQQGVEVGRRAGADRRQIAQALEVGDDEIDDAVPEAPQLVGRERERVYAAAIGWRRRSASAIASAREWTPSFRMMFLTWL